MQFVKGPDFPTGGIIYNQKEILEAYSQGKGAIVTRGKAEITEKEEAGKVRITSPILLKVMKRILCISLCPI